PEELEGGEAEQAQVHAREARQPPVLGARRDQRVDALALRGDAVDQLAGEGLDLGLGVEVRPEEGDARIALPRHVELVERLEGQLARRAPGRSEERRVGKERSLVWAQSA